MRKAKVILSAIAVFAIVGGAMAVKATRFGASNIYRSYTTVAGGPTYCTLTTFKTTLSGGVIALTYTGTTDFSLCKPAVQTRIIATPDLGL